MLEEILEQRSNIHREIIKCIKSVGLQSIEYRAKQKNWFNILHTQAVEEEEEEEVVGKEMKGWRTYKPCTLLKNR